MPKRITLEMVLRWKPCKRYSQERILKLGNGLESLTPLEAFNLPIPKYDILWLLLRPEIIPEKELYLLACFFAEPAVEIYEKHYPGDLRPRNAIAAKRAWVENPTPGTEKNLEAAKSAADAITGSIAFFAATASITSSAYSAAKQSINTVASEAVKDGTKWKTIITVKDSLMAAQLAEVRKVLERLEKEGE